MGEFFLVALCKTLVLKQRLQFSFSVFLSHRASVSAVLISSNKLASVLTRQGETYGSAGISVKLRIFVQVQSPFPKADRAYAQVK